MDALRLERQLLKGSQNTTERSYYDFIINENSLREILRTHLIGSFGWAMNNYDKELAKQFMGLQPSDLESVRYPLFVCPECGDIGCGMITMDIVFEQNQVIWKNFAYEKGYEPIDFEYFYFLDEPLNFNFDKTNYFKVFEKF